MGYTAFEELKMEYRALQLIAILIEDELKQSNGLTTKKILDRIYKRTSGNLLSYQDFKDLREKIDGTWTYGTDVCIEHIGKGRKNADSKEKILYNLSNNLSAENWDQLIRVAICIALLKRGKIETFERYSVEPGDKKNEFLNMINLITTLQKGINIKYKDTLVNVMKKGVPKRVLIQGNIILEIDTINGIKKINLKDIITSEKTEIIY